MGPGSATGPGWAASHDADVAGADGAKRANGSGARCTGSWGISPSGMGAGSHGGPPGAETSARVTVLGTGVTRTGRPWALTRELAPDRPPLRPRFRVLRRVLPPGTVAPGTVLPGIGPPDRAAPGGPGRPGPPGDAGPVKGGAPGTGRMRGGGPLATACGAPGKAGRLAVRAAAPWSDGWAWIRRSWPPGASGPVLHRAAPGAAACASAARSSAAALGCLAAAASGPDGALSKVRGSGAGRVARSARRRRTRIPIRLASSRTISRTISIPAAMAASRSTALARLTMPVAG